MQLNTVEWMRLDGNGMDSGGVKANRKALKWNGMDQMWMEENGRVIITQGRKPLGWFHKDTLLLCGRLIVRPQIDIWKFFLEIFNNQDILLGKFSEEQSHRENFQ